MMKSNYFVNHLEEFVQKKIAFMVFQLVKIKKVLSENLKFLKYFGDKIF